MKTSRESLLGALESVRPGLETKPNEVIEQSKCFVFDNNEIITHNDEVACRRASPLNGVVGAVQAEDVLEILRLLPDDDIIVEQKNAELVISGKGGRKAGFRMESEIVLPIDRVEAPKKWKPLHSDFAEAIGKVHQCAGKDESRYAFVCVHVHPEFVEASDNMQLCRWKLETGFRKPVLVKSTSIKHITQAGVTEFSETSAWVHFRNPQGLVISCRRFTDVEDYPDLSSALKVKGTKIALPRGLAEGLDRAKIPASENMDDKMVMVTLTNGRVKIRGEGVRAWYTETRKINYAGPELAFMIAPDLLKGLIQNYSECMISADHLKIDMGEQYTYVACLVRPDELKGDSE